jgi:L-malate glycosyltransferase
LKIAHIDTGKDFRGGQDLLLSLARGLNRRGHVQLIVAREAGPLAARAAAEGLQVRTLGSIGNLRRVLREEGFDIVHAHDGRAQTISFRASMGLPVVRVASRLVAFQPRHPLVHRWKYSLTSHGVIALSQAVRKVLLDAGVPDAHIETIVPGIELPAKLPDARMRDAARAKWGVASGEFAIGHMGAFTHEKGQDIALQAAIGLASKLPRARMLLAGDGPRRSEAGMLELARRASGIAQLPGFVDDVDEFYAALDVFIMPSRAEAWGLTALRAMAFGLPVIASNVGGLPEVAEHGQSGWLIEPESPAALEEAILEAASDAGRLAEFGRRARMRAEQFSIARTVERTEHYYARLLAQAGKATMENSVQPTV